MHIQGRFAHLAAVVLAALCWGTIGTAKTLGPEASAISVAALRCLIASLVMIAYSAVRVRHNRLRVVASCFFQRRYFVLAFLAALGFNTFQAGFFAGVDRLGVALGTMIAIGASPLFAGLIEIVLKNPPSRSWYFATMLAIVGCGLLVFANTSTPSGSDGGIDGFGVFMSLLAAFGYASYAAATGQLVRHVDTTIASTTVFTLAALMLLPSMFFSNIAWAAEPSGMLMILHIAVVATAFAYLVYTWGRRQVDTSTATTLSLAEPAMAALLAVLLLEERLSAAQWVGAATILIGVLWVSVLSNTQRSDFSV